MRTFELTPHNGRKSFGGKAKVIETEDKIQLRSYDTIVAEIDKITKEFTVNGKYSRTTDTHIKSFKGFYSSYFPAQSYNYAQTARITT